MKLSVCMIVKNEARVLEKTLPALSQGADEIIVVDTGSSDDTVKVAEKYGAKVHCFAWIDDFSAARNESLKYAAGDWIIWVDADEYIKPEELAALKTTLEKTDEDALLLPIYECRYGETEGENFYFRVKVFRNKKGIHFERPFNEQVYGKDGILLETKAFHTDMKIAHWGRFLAEEKLKNKKDRNFRILEEAIKKDPADACYHFLLANNFWDINEKEKAYEEYLKVIELDKGSLAAGSRIKCARILIDKNAYEEAYGFLKDAVSTEPWNAEGYNLIAVVYLNIGNTPKAIQVLEYSSKLPIPQNNLQGADLAQFGYFPNYLLGNAYLLAEDKVKAISAFETAYKLNPNEKLLNKIDTLKKEVDKNV